MTPVCVDEQHVKLAIIDGDEIFFQVVNTDEPDGFTKDKDKKCLTRMIKNNEKQFLVVDAGCLIFEDRNNEERKREGGLFNICCYKNTEQHKFIGVAVTLTVSYKGQNWIIYCDNSEEKVSAKPLPNDESDPDSNAMFYLQSVKEACRQCYRLESFRWPNLFLGYKPKEDLEKLVLRKRGEDVVEGLQLLEP